MKILKGILLVGILTLLLGMILPWWSIGIAGLLGGLFFGESAFKSFLIAFLGSGLSWMILAIYIDQKNAGLMSSKIAQLFNGIPSESLIIATALIGGLTSGLSGLTGYFGKKSLANKNTAE